MSAVSLLDTLGLSAEAIAGRVRSIGGSDANIIMSGDDAAVLRLWEQKTGRREPEDLGGVLPVVMGQFTEPLNRAWFAKQTGLAVRDDGHCCACGKDAWRTATLDGRVFDGDTALGIFEAKHVNPFGKAEESLAKYQPQLHHNMACAGLSRAYLSLFRGNMDWCFFEVEYDTEYGAAVRQAEWRFWLAVQGDEPPVAYPAPPPPKPTSFREVDMTGSNAWAAHAADWLDTREAAARCDKAKDALKKMIEADVSRAFGHGVELTRDKRGAIRLAAMEA